MSQETPRTTFAGWTRIVDAETRTGILGLRVFVDNTMYGPSDADGRVWVEGRLGTRLLTLVKGTQYYTRRTVNVTAEFPSQLDVCPTVVAPHYLTFATAQQWGITLTVCLENDTVLEQTMTDTSGVASTAQAYIPGVYKITASKPGYVAMSTLITVTATVSTYAVTPPTLVGNGSREGTTASRT